MLDLVQRLCSIASVSYDRDNIALAYQLIIDEFAGLDNVHIQQRHTPGEISGIVISNAPGKDFDIMFNGHIDVVPPSEVDQFSPKIIDNKLYARGAGDMKAGVVVMVETMKRVLQSPNCPYKVALMITGDEEIGGFLGVKKLVELGFQAQLAIIPDSGSMSQIVYKEKGSVMANMLAQGKSAHSARPWLGSNPFDKVISYYHDLKINLQENEDLQAPGKRGTTVELTQIQGGFAENALPDHISFTLNVRFTETYTADMISNLLQSYGKRYNCELLNTKSCEVLCSDRENPLFNQYMQTARNTLDMDVQWSCEHGASDGRHFAAAGMDVLLHRPNCGNLHSQNEWVNIQQLDKLQEVWERFLGIR